MDIALDTVELQRVFAVRLAGRVYQFTIVPTESDTTLWVSVQSILPLPAKLSHIQPLGEITNQPHCVSNPAHTPILCDRSAYTGEPVARITHHPTKQVIPLYYASEWLTTLHARAPIIYYHNERYWLCTEYNRELVQQYREQGGKWCARARCWVFREPPKPLLQPATEPPVFAP